MYPLILDWDRLKNVSTFSVMNGGITGEGQILLLILYQKLDTTLSYTDTIHYPVIHRYQTLPCHTQILDSRHYPVITDTRHYSVKHRYQTVDTTLSSQILDTTLSNTAILDTTLSNTDTGHYPVKHRYWTLPCQTQLYWTLSCQTQILYTTLSNTDTYRHYPVKHR